MYVLGIDPGLATVGFGVLRVENRKVSPITFGVITTPAGAPFAERLHQIKTDLLALIAKYPPVAVGVEELFFATNTKTAIKVAEARGVILETLFSKGIPCHEMTPLQLKNDICGDGGADKIQMQTMIKMLLGLAKAPKPDDAADALAIALYTARVARLA